MRKKILFLFFILSLVFSYSHAALSARADTIPYANCPEPAQVLLSSPFDDQIKVQWQDNMLAQKVKIKYRDKSKNKWYEETTTDKEFYITKLKPNTEYEVKIANVCLGDIETYSQPASLKTKEKGKTEIPNFACGTPPKKLDLSNKNPISGLMAGDKIMAGDFEVELLEVQGSGGKFSGRGFMRVPYFKLAKLNVVFNNIKVNTDKRLIDGYFQAVVDWENGSIVNTTELLKNIGEILNNFSKKSDSIKEKLRNGEKLDDKIIEEQNKEIDKIQQILKSDSSVTSKQGSQNAEMYKNILSKIQKGNSCPPCNTDDDSTTQGSLYEPNNEILYASLGKMLYFSNGDDDKKKKKEDNCTICLEKAEKIIKKAIEATKENLNKVFETKEEVKSYPKTGKTVLMYTSTGKYIGKINDYVENLVYISKSFFDEELEQYKSNNFKDFKNKTPIEFYKDIKMAGLSYKLDDIKNFYKTYINAFPIKKIEGKDINKLKNITISKKGVKLSDLYAESTLIGVIDYDNNIVSFSGLPHTEYDLVESSSGSSPKIHTHPNVGNKLKIDYSIGMSFGSYTLYGEEGPSSADRNQFNMINDDYGNLRDIVIDKNFIYFYKGSSEKEYDIILQNK